MLAPPRPLFVGFDQPTNGKPIPVGQPVKGKEASSWWSLEKAAVEDASRIAIVARRPEIQRRDERVGRIEPWIQGRGVAKTGNEESRANEEERR